MFAIGRGLDADQSRFRFLHGGDYRGPWKRISHEMQPAQGMSVNWTTPSDVVTPALQRVWEQHMAEHPGLAHVVRTGDGGAAKISDFLSRRQFHRLGLYNEFYRLLGVEDGLSFALSVSPDLVIGMGLHRSRQTFSERDRQLLNLLRPHLIQAYHNATAVTRMQQELVLVLQGVTRLERGVIVLSREGKVELLTERAQQWMAAYFGRAAGTTDRLPEALQRWVRHQQDLSDTAEVPGPREPLVIERDEARLIVRLVEEAEHSFLLLEEQQTCLQPAALAGLGLEPSGD